MDPKTGLPIKPGPYKANECQTCGTPFNGRGREMDHHIDSKLSKQEVQEELNRAAEQVKALRGSLPGQIESLLKQLNNPQLKASDLIRNARFSFKLNQGNLNDYKRLRRRGLGYETPLYQWKKKEYASEWVTLLDTSGSMSDADIANGVKELQLVGGEGHGWIVPCDAEPHWNARVEVNSKTDIQRTKIVGRGGTVFDAFFKGLKEHFPKGFDSVIIITDGDCGNIDIKLKPPCEVVWVITNQRKFEPTFGRVCYLNPA
jgi:predicted metal-dependent peptidase